MHKTDLIWGGTWGGTANFWGGMCPPRSPLGDATGLIYGYSRKKSGNGGSSNINNLKSLVGTKSDDETIDTAFGRIKKNKDDIASTATSVVASTEKVVASVVTSINNTKSLVGTKSDDKTVDSAFGRIKKNSEIANFSAVEKLNTSYFYLLDVSPGPHFIKKTKTPKWKP